MKCYLVCILTKSNSSCVLAHWKTLTKTTALSELSGGNENRNILYLNKDKFACT